MASETHAIVSHLHTLHYDKLRHTQSLFFCARVQFLVSPVANCTIVHCVSYIDTPSHPRTAQNTSKKARSLVQAPLTHQPRGRTFVFVPNALFLLVPLTFVIFTVLPDFCFRLLFLSSFLFHSLFSLSALLLVFSTLHLFT